MPVDAITEFQGMYRPLSNFWYVSVKMPDIAGVDKFVYPSVEHAYQAAKFYNLTTREHIKLAYTPLAAKKLGRNYSDMREDWEQIKIDVMRDLCYQKFQKRYLRNLLVSTGNKMLVEGNYWHNNFWGVCSCNVCRSNMHIFSENWLGKILMEIRSNLL